MPTILVSDLPTSTQIQRSFDLVVSLLDVGIDAEECFGEIDPNRHLIVHVDDVEGGVSNCPEERHIRQVFSFLDSRMTEDSDILVHCHAGISRSTAMAIGILIKFFKKTPKEAINIVFMQRREVMWPNMRIIRLVDKELNLHGELERAVKIWKKDNLHPQLRIGPFITDF